MVTEQCNKKKRKNIWQKLNVKKYLAKNIYTTIVQPIVLYKRYYFREVQIWYISAIRIITAKFYASKNKSPNDKVIIVQNVKIFSFFFSSYIIFFLHPQDSSLSEMKYYTGINDIYNTVS